MARQTEKFGFMLRYGPKTFLHDAIRNNHPDLGLAKAHVIEKALQKMPVEELKDHAINHPHKVLKVMAREELKDRGESV